MINAAEIGGAKVVEAIEPVVALRKLDLACGQQKQEGFIGVDICQCGGVDVVHDLRQIPWPFEDNSIDEARCSHFFEHLEPTERINFMNELWRILKPGAGCIFITPAGYDRQVQDYTHKWPPVVVATYCYFDVEWMKANKLDHYIERDGIRCNFETRPLQASVIPEYASRTEEFKLMVMQQYKNALVDLIVLLVKREKL